MNCCATVARALWRQGGDLGRGAIGLLWRSRVGCCADRYCGCHNVGGLDGWRWFDAIF